jgi:putative addiction module component (TIGR02574 family)
MTQPAGRLLDEALRLSEPERAELAARLIESLDPAVDDVADLAWGEEVRQRIDELDRGQASTVPWSDARRTIEDDSERPTTHG